MNTGHPRRRRFFFFPVIGAAFALLAGGAVMLLWNATLPAVTGVRHLSYWQAVGLLVLCRLLFGNFRGGRFGGPPSFRRHGWREKWLEMDADKRRRFREEWQQRCATPPGREPDDSAEK